MSTVAVAESLALPYVMGLPVRKVPMASATAPRDRALDRFLASVERRAYRMAEMATRSHHDALDVVQDAMLALVTRYSERPEAEWGPLFHRILQTRLLDYHRRQKVRGRVLSFFRPVASDCDDDEDMSATLPDLHTAEPAVSLERARDMDTVLDVLRRLPMRQQQAFLLRIWEGYDVAHTAEIMGCSEGSVKTHLFRATQALRHALES